MNISAYIGLPYKSQGRSRAGIDCWGLCQLFYREQFNTQIPSYDESYADASAKTSVASAIHRHEGEWVRVDSPEPGDVVVFNIMGFPCHCGIYIGDGDFLHSFKRTATCIESLDSIVWQRRIYGIFRWNQNTNN